MRPRKQKHKKQQQQKKKTSALTEIAFADRDFSPSQ